MNYGFQFLFILLIVALGCIKVTLQGRICKGYIRNSADSLVFNAEIFAAIALVMFILFKVSVPDETLILFALVTAASNLIFQSTYAVALNAGPVSITVLIVNFSVLITTGASIVIFGEKFYMTQMIGVVFLIASMFLSVSKAEGEQKASKRWLLLTLTASITTAVGGLLQKYYGRIETNVEAADTTFLFFMYGFASLFGIILAAIKRFTGKKEKSTFGFNKKVILYAGTIGLVLGVYQKFYMYALTNIEGTFLFPTYSGLSSLVMTLIGVVLFKDSLSQKQIRGVACGVICIALMNLRVGFYF